MTHRVVRGGLLACGRPDGRLMALTSNESCVCLSVNQASSIQNMNQTCSPHPSCRLRQQRPFGDINKSRSRKTLTSHGQESVHLPFPPPLTPSAPRRCETMTIGHNPYPLALAKHSIFLKVARPPPTITVREGGTRRVQLVREGGTRRVQLVREGGGGEGCSRRADLARTPCFRGGRGLSARAAPRRVACANATKTRPHPHPALTPLPYRPSARCSSPSASCTRRNRPFRPFPPGSEGPASGLHATISPLAGPCPPTPPQAGGPRGGGERRMIRYRWGRMQ
jgi:hypothetical protein